MSYAFGHTAAGRIIMIDSLEHGMLFNHLARRACWAGLVSLSFASALSAQTINYFGTSGSLAGSTWSTNPGGPYTSAFNTTGGGIATFNNVATAAGAAITVAGIDVGANLTLSSVSGTISNLSNGVIPITVASGATADFSTQSWTTSISAGYIKNGAGVLALAGNTYGGGFTLNAGTVIARGINAMGGNTTTPGPLNLNSGIVAANATRDFSGKYSAINIGGNIQFGDTVGLASASANMTFSNTVALGGVNRTLTVGNNGTTTFSGVVGNTGGVGLTFSGTGATGSIAFTNAANTFSGNITILGGEARFTSDGSLGAVPGSVTPDSILLDGGRLGSPTSGTLTINSNRGIQVSAAAGTAFTPNGSSSIVYNGVIADKPSTTGVLTKRGSGTLSLGGVSTYSGDTILNQGVVILTTGNDRLPTGTTVSMGQAASSNTAFFDLNGNNQTIAGLNSIAGTNASTARNTVLSDSGNATLTLNGSGNYSFSDSTPSNSGNITGMISIVKNGSGLQAFGGSNTYLGTTTINSGTLAINSNQAGSGLFTVNTGGTLQGTGNINSNITVAGGTIAPGNSAGILHVNGNITLSSTSTVSIEINGNTPGGGGYDQINILGTTRVIDLGNSILSVTLSGYTPLPTDKFFIINNDDDLAAINGIFFNQPNGSNINIGGYVGKIAYTGDFLNGGGLTGGNDVVIYELMTAVPEPGAIALMGLAGFGALQWYLRRKPPATTAATEEPAAKEIV